jgi:hypothetical protein
MRWMMRPGRPVGRIKVALVTASADAPVAEVGGLNRVDRDTWQSQSDEPLPCHGDGRGWNLVFGYRTNAVVVHTYVTRSVKSPSTMPRRIADTSRAWSRSF